MVVDRYSSPGLVVALGLVNQLVVAEAPDPAVALREVLGFDPTSIRVLGVADVPGFDALAHDLHGVFASLDGGDTDSAAAAINVLLAACPAHPHLAKDEDGAWSVHHQPAKADLVSSWAAICAEALARVVGEGRAARARLCEATDCRRAFLDTTRNGTRRFCSTTCQNRIKAAALRRRRAAHPPEASEHE
ncbi:MAG: CGNR zinc finger domain-containing protein [Jiangellaceae bacterium]